MNNMQCQLEVCDTDAQLMCADTNVDSLVARLTFDQIERMLDHAELNLNDNHVLVSREWILKISGKCKRKHLKFLMVKTNIL